MQRAREWFQAQTRGTRTLIIGAAVLLVLGAVSGIVRGGPEATGSAARRTTPPTAASHSGDDEAADEPPAGPGPTDSAGGVGVGFSHDEAGAAAAGLSYAAAPQSWLYISDREIAEGVAAVTIADAREEITADVSQQVGLLRDELTNASGPVWFVVAPLAHRVEDYTGDRAVVRVWVVRVLSAEGVAMPQAGWQTVTLHLRWHGGDWKIASIDEEDGPTPQLETGLEPWAADYLAERLEGFSRVGAT